MRVLIFSLFISALIMNCKSNPYKPDLDMKEKIYFGSEGGVAGSRNEFILVKTGQIYKKVDTTYKKVASLKENTALQLFELAQNSNVFTQGYNEPGNMSQFMEFKTLKNTDRLVWSQNDASLPKNIKTFYGILSKAIK
jgi:hypothetical protein